MMARVVDDREASDLCDEGSQARLCSHPYLFSMMFLAMLTDAIRDSDPSIRIRFRSDGIPRRL